MSAEIEIDEAPIALYRLYNAAGDVIRVGVSEDLARRFRDYARDVPWWPEVARKTVEWHPDRESALWAETGVIYAKHPAHNVLPSRTPGSRSKAKYPLDHDPECVTYARQQSGLTKTQVARAVGISLSLLSEIEKGTRNATPDNLRKISEVLNCPVAVLERKRHEVSDEEPEAAIAV